MFGCLDFADVAHSGTFAYPTDRPHLHTPIGLAIAIGKAVLVICFFMHLLHTDRVSWVMLAVAVFMLFVLLYLTMADYVSRAWLGA